MRGDGIGKDHRIPLAELKCMIPKRVKELELYLGLGCAARRRGGAEDRPALGHLTVSKEERCL